MDDEDQSDYESQIRDLLRSIRDGHREAFNELIGRIEGEMTRLSASILASRPAVPTIQATVLVNEVVLKLIAMLNRDAQQFPQTKRHLVNLMCRMMRFTLIDYARKRKLTEPLDELTTGDSDQVDGGSGAIGILDGWTAGDLDNLLALERALDIIEQSDAKLGKRRRDAVELYLFGGMNYPEIAAELDISDDAAERDCKLAIARVREILGSGGQPAARAAGA